MTPTDELSLSDCRWKPDGGEPDVDVLVDGAQGGAKLRWGPGTITRRRREFKESIPYWGASVTVEAELGSQRHRGGRGHARIPEGFRCVGQGGVALGPASGRCPVRSVLGTVRDLAFVGEPLWEFNAFHARTGELSWQFQTGSGHHSNPDDLQRRRTAVT